MERHEYNPNQPGGSMSLQGLRNALRGLHQCDLMPLRPSASKNIDDMEYSTNALAAAAFSGTGCTVTTDGTTKYAGNYALKIVVDATGNRRAEKSQTLVLTGFKEVKFWDYVDVSTSAYQFFLKDGSGNESYWDINSHATMNTWKQQTITLASPDSNNGTAASLGSITSWGFRGLDASKTYRFDSVESTCGLNVNVEPAVIGSYYAPIYVGETHIGYTGGASSALSTPATNPRLSLLTINASGTLNWTHGAEAASPAEPTYPAGEMPICLVYCRVGMTKVVNFVDAAANPTEGYIYKDVRPLFFLGVASFLSLTDTPDSYSSKALNRLRVNTGATAVEFVLDKLITLQDAPASYTGKSKKAVRVNSGETAVEFVDVDKITDADADTRIVTEENTDEDKIKFYTAGTRRMLLDLSGLLLQNGSNPVNEFSTDGTFASNSNSKVPTERAVKTYVDAQINPLFVPNNIQVFTANGTWIKPAGVSRIYVKVWGGGGAGSGASGPGRSQLGGGGGGGYSEGYISVTTNVTVTVGTGGVSGNGSGPSGGNSSVVGETTIQANGGAGGNGPSGGAGGTATGGQLNVTGEAGRSGKQLGNAQAYYGGSGGAAFGQQGTPGDFVGALDTISMNGVDARNVGAGGSGGGKANSGSASTGGSGKDGMVIIYY